MVPAHVRRVLNPVGVSVSVGQLVQDRPRRRTPAASQRLAGQVNLMYRGLARLARGPLIRVEVPVRLRQTLASRGAPDQNDLRDTLVACSHRRYQLGRRLQHLDHQNLGINDLGAGRDLLPHRGGANLLEHYGTPFVVTPTVPDLTSGVNPNTGCGRSDRSRTRCSPGW